MATSGLTAPLRRNRDFNLLVGFVLEAFGTTPTVLVLAGVMAVVAGAAALSPAIRSAPARA